MFYEGDCKMIVYVIPNAKLEFKSHRLWAMQSKRSIWKGATSFIVNLTTFGDDIEHTLAPPYAIMFEDFVDVLHPLPSELPP